MADQTPNQGEQLQPNTRTRHRDMGDGTFAPVVATGVPIVRAKEYGKAVGANTDVLGADIEPIATPCIMRVQLAFSAAQMAKAHIKAGATYLLELNGGSNLNAEALYIFDVVLQDDERLNLQFDGAGTVRVLSVTEIGTWGP